MTSFMKMVIHHTQRIVWFEHLYNRVFTTKFKALAVFKVLHLRISIQAILFFYKLAVIIL